MLFPAASALSQVSVDTMLARKLYPYTFFYTDNYLNLENGWEVGGRPEKIPFTFPIEQAGFSCTFSIAECPPEVLYLYFEGFAWSGEVILNGHYLGFFPRPFEPQIVRVDSQWLDTERNFLQVNLSRGQVYPLFPQQFICVFRPVWLVTESQLAAIVKRAMPEIAFADTVAVVAPYFRTARGYAFDEFEAARNLQPLKKAGIRHIYFPFEPGRRFEAFCAEAGFVRVRSLENASRICVVNAWPWETSTFPWKFLPWLDISGRRTTDYGEFFPVKGYAPSVFMSKDRLSIALMILMPLIFVFIMKLASPGFFHSLSSVLFKPKLYIDFSMEVGSAQQGLLFLLHLFRLLSMSGALALGVYVVSLHHGWSYLSLIRDPSLMHQVFYKTGSFSLIFLKSMGAVVAWFVVKYMLIILIGRIFKIKGMVDGMLNLEIVGTYPLILMMPLLLVAFLLTEGSGLWIIGILLALITSAYYLRRLYVMYVGLNRLFGFSLGMKILYICTFNIFAYLIWL
ncbi:MAG: hypothetical protein R3C61_06870 [Bacteroidia bacterium]